MRKTTWITLFVAMFMFQSFWNVAAAFCVHETNTRNVQTQNHFGHHQTFLCQAEQNQQHNEQDLKNNNTQHLNSDHKNFDSANDQSKSQTIEDDHQDHLPSMAHLILINARYLQASYLFTYVIKPEYIWDHVYQAPDLFLSSPPPEFSPLMVG